MSRSHLPLSLLLIAVTTLPACDKVPLMAPTESTIVLNVSTTIVPVNGTAQITASVIESAGTPVQNGTVVYFTSSFGTIEPAEGRTEAGRATVIFRAGQQSGTAVIGASSGAAKAETVEIRVGGAAAAAIVVRAEPQTISASGGTAEIIATVLDQSGNPLPGVPVTFSTTAGQLNPGQSVSGPSGEARTTLTASRTATITARAGEQTATVEVIATNPAVTITPPATVEAGIPASFKLTPATGGNPIREVVVDWGDGSAQTRLGSISGETSVVHVYARRGVYTITVTATDTEGITGTSTLIVNVTEQSSVPVTLTATPNPVNRGLQLGLVTFTASAGGLGSSASIVAYEWDFGDGTGTVTTGSTTNHRYGRSDTFIATVTVRTTTGTTGFAQVTVVVNN